MTGDDALPCGDRRLPRHRFGIELGSPTSMSTLNGGSEAALSYSGVVKKMNR
jgi:hypothetical protein